MAIHEYFAVSRDSSEVRFNHTHESPMTNLAEWCVVLFGMPNKAGAYVRVALASRPSSGRAVVVQSPDS